jgi:hypothetical protein
MDWSSAPARHGYGRRSETFFARGFVLLEERADREIVIGLEGASGRHPAISAPLTRGGSKLRAIRHAAEAPEYT